MHEEKYCKMSKISIFLNQYKQKDPERTLQHVIKKRNKRTKKPNPNSITNSCPLYQKCLHETGYTAVCLCKHPTEATFQENILKCTWNFLSARRSNQQELTMPLGKTQTRCQSRIDCRTVRSESFHGKIKSPRQSR